MITNFGPQSPAIEVINEDNPHGTGWHIIKGGEVTPESWEYEHNFRQWLRYESERGTCGNMWKSGKPVYRDSLLYGEPERYCHHGENHKWQADYFMKVDGSWELGAN